MFTKKLHEAMRKKGFFRTIKFGDDPNTYELPSAEYNRVDEEDKLTKETVLKDAKDGAGTEWKNFSVLVTQTNPSPSLL
jgi:hypothetical protein